MKENWTKKYVKLTRKKTDSWFFKQYTQEDLYDSWAIVVENKPGKWDVLKKSNVLQNCTPSPLTIRRGSKPDIDHYFYQELTKEEAFIEIL